MNNSDETKLTLKNIPKEKTHYLSIGLLTVICITILIIIFVVGITIQTSYEVSGKVDQNSIHTKEQKEQLEKQIQQEILEQQEKQRIENEKKEQTKRLNMKLPVLTQEGIDRMENIYSGDVKRVFLTFDDGPSENTPAILDILKQNNINATFFVLGNNVDSKPEYVKRAWEENNYIASHGVTHAYKQLYSSIDNIVAEYEESVVKIRNAIGNDEYDPHLFRFPGGKAGRPYNDIKQQASEVLKEKGIFNVDWSALSGDAEGNNFPVEHLLERTIQTVGEKNNIVLLMHDSQAKTTTVDALQSLIDYFKNNGYEFLTFYDIFDTKEDLIENQELVEIKIQ